MISFGVEAPGGFQDVSGAIFNTVSAPFAPVFYYMDHPF
jgi:hypothetical protein